ncbi:hypothetical protein VitviT2T_029256 [Vitis vinifera]|uniref:Uncharacterized protein n=1 Tax=Vitis vinifera TaxID=29760 RepID=A0ABY9DXF2_VITVI|nr:hypothetical protein VitviT2T_029256 [Vitis vinifera]
MDASNVGQMTETGAIDALLDLLRSHQCEEPAGRLLEAVFNNVRVREVKVPKYVTAPLSQYLLDPQTRSQSGRLLAALALGDLPQYEGFARASGFVSACRALISLLEDQPTEETKSITYQKDLSQIRPTEAESVETRIIILFSSVVALKRSLFDTRSNPTSESVVKPFAEREHLAAAKRNEEIVRFLIQHRANTNGIDNF